MLRTFATVLIAALLGMTRSAAESPTAEEAAELRALLAHLEILELEDGQGRVQRTLRFEGVNVQIVNGSDSTATSNGLGNLLIGYGETSRPLERTGSHNLVLGTANDYTSYGSILSGTGNAVSCPDSAAIASQGSLLEGLGSNVVLSGLANRVNGRFNTIVSGDSSVIGGSLFSTITGSWFSLVDSSQYSHVLGGQGHRIRESNEATITGGERHTLESAGITSVLGGVNHFAEDSTGGAMFGGESNALVRCEFGTVMGGEGNAVSGDHAVVGGGLRRMATGNHDWVAGSLFEDN